MPQEFARATDIHLPDFAALCSQEVTLAEYPLASDVQKKILIYSGTTFRHAVTPDQEVALKAELHRALKDGPGVLVIQEALTDLAVIDRATEVFQHIIAQEKQQSQHRGDHFAKPGDNERIWNALQKFGEADPATFIDYYTNSALGLVSEAWLGPFFQMTSQVNIVKPGGQAQKPHRDYHLGFQEDAIVEQFPVSVQVASQFLTLQGAVAHTDMTVASGPTLLLPFSQQYPLGYLAWRQPEFAAFFEEHAVQLPLRKGDAVFFSPALFHAAGTNREGHDRIANLLQVSVAFGKTMETINWETLITQSYPYLLQKHTHQQLPSGALRWLGGSVADGYSFPTNLDSDPPLHGSAPETQQALVLRALQEAWPPEQFNQALKASLQRRLA